MEVNLLFITAVAWFHLFFAVVWVGPSVLSFAVLGPVVSTLTPASRGRARFCQPSKGLVWPSGQQRDRTL